MESCNSEISKDDVYASFNSLRELGGGGGIKGRRIWLLMEVTKKNSKKCGDFLSLSDLFGFDVPKKLVEIIGRRWKNHFTKHAMGKGFVTRSYMDGEFVTVCEDSFGPSLGPDEETLPKREECLVGKALKRKFVNLKPWLNAQQNEPTTITPALTRTSTKRSAAKAHDIALETPSPNNNNELSPQSKIQRQNGMGDKGTPPPSKSIPSLDGANSTEEWIKNIAMPVILEHIGQCKGELSPEVQSIAQSVMMKLEDPKTRLTNLEYLDSSKRVRHRTYLRLKKPRAHNSDSKQKSKTDLITRKAEEVQRAADAVFNGKVEEDIIDKVFEKLAKGRNLVVLNAEGIQLTIEEIASLRDYCGLSSAKTIKFKQGMETLRPELKHLLFVANIKDRLTKLEREGNLPIEVKKLPLITKKEGNKMNLRIVWWLQNPAKMMERLLNMTICDETFEDSEEFSKLVDQIVVLWGIDKSSEDTGCAIRVANRKGGNNQLYTMLIGAMENAAECYSNLRDTFFSKDCPLRDFLQALVYDHYQVLSVKIGSQCQTFTFTPCPTMDPCTTRRLRVRVDDAVSEVEDDDMFYALPSNGLPPEITMNKSTKEVRVRLVKRVVTKTDEVTKKTVQVASVVGFQMIRPSGVDFYSQMFSDEIVLEDEKDVEMAKVSIRQVNGHVGNDGKQSLILKGICSASALCSCLCCLREKGKFSIPSEQIQRRRDPDGKKTLIPDAPLREGEYSIINTSREYAKRTGRGKLNLPEAYAREINVETGSSFYYHLIDIPHIKENGGILHESGGWINHFYAAIRAFLRSLEENADWMVNARRVLTTELVNILNQFAAPKAGETSNYRQLYNENKVLLKIARDTRMEAQKLRSHQDKGSEDDESEDSAEVTEAEEAAKEAYERAVENAEKLADVALKNCVDHADMSHFAHLNFLKKDAADMETHLSQYLKSTKKPRGKAEHAFNSALQTMAGGKFLPQHSGFEHTTGNGMNTLPHFDLVADAVVAVYPPDHPLHTKIKEAFVGFRKVAVLLFPFLTYTNSQKLRDVDAFLDLLDPLLLVWDETFPDKKYFLKLHHIMAHLPDFVDRYGMLGRISEESFESVHALMARVKSLVASMHSDSQRIETANAKTQTKLKPGCMEATIAMVEGGKGKKRGPPKNKPKRPHNSVKLLSDIQFKEKRVGGKTFIEVLEGKARLPIEWRDLYLLVTAGKVPESWTLAAFDESAHLSDDKKEEAKFMIH